MKYFVLGALASGLLLYGMSMLYGATGSLDLGRVASAIAAPGANKIILIFGLVFVVSAIAFKLGAVPYHMWLPDVYDGAPTAITLFIGTAPKLAAFAFMMRLLVGSLSSLAFDWQGMLIVLSLLSMIFGNVIAIAQTNIKRMLAYSTIANMGFMLMGFLAASVNGYSAAMFYTVTYVLTTLVGFGLILLLSRRGFEADQLDDFKGLNQRSPWYAFMMLLTMFSLAGVPPTVGFYAKFSVIEAAVDIGLVWLAVVAVVASLDRRVLLSAHRQAHVLRRARRCVAHLGAAGHARAFVAQRPGAAAARHLPAAAHGTVCRRAHPVVLTPAGGAEASC